MLSCPAVADGRVVVHDVVDARRTVVDGEERIGTS